MLASLLLNCSCGEAADRTDAAPDSDVSAFRGALTGAAAWATDSEATVTSADVEAACVAAWVTFTCGTAGSIWTRATPGLTRTCGCAAAAGVAASAAVPWNVTSTLSNPAGRTVVALETV